MSSPDPLIRQLRKEAAPLRLLKGRPVLWGRDPKESAVSASARAHHDDAWKANAGLYALSAIATGVSVSQRSRALYVILSASWAELSLAERKTVSRVARMLLAALPARIVLTILLALRRARANHKHTARAIVRYLTEHPNAEEMARTRRPAVRDALEHAVGRNTARGAAKKSTDTCGAPSKGLPYCRDPIRAQTLLAILYGDESVQVQAPIATTAPSYVSAHETYAAALDSAQEVPKTITATNRGDVSATLVHIYRGGSTPDLERGLVRFVEKAASKLPVFEGKIALVLDASASMRGYGEREYCAIAQSVALMLVLARACPNLTVIPVAGATSSSLPRVGSATAPIPIQPEGPTDLASALIEAAACEPDVIAIVTDGYENREDGDLAAVARALPGAQGRSVPIPIVMCQSKFTFKDDLALRRPAPFLDEVGFWHQDDFSEVLLTLASRTNPAMASTFSRQALEARLARVEKEREPWISAP